MKILYTIIGLLLIFVAFHELTRALAVTEGVGHAGAWFKFIVLLALAGALIFFVIRGLVKKKHK